MASVRYIVKDVEESVGFYTFLLGFSVAALRDAGAVFRNDIISGPGGKQVIVEDPSGNAIEIFQAG